MTNETKRWQELTSQPLVKGRLYRLLSRNLPYGIYDGNGGFIGIREKFYHLFLDTEVNGSTAVAVEDLGWDVPEPIVVAEVLPDRHSNEPLFHFLVAAEGEFGRGVGYGGRPGDDDLSGM